METVKSEEGNKVETESETIPDEQTSGEVEETQGVEAEAETIEETLPKRRYNELLARYKKQEEDLGKAVAYINQYIVQKQAPQSPTSVEQKLAALETKYGQLEQNFNYRLLKEQKEAELVGEVEGVLEKNPHLREWSQEIYQAVAFDPDRTATDIAKAFNARLGKVGKAAVTNVVTTKKAVANHATSSSVPSKLPAPAAKKSAIASAKDFDALEDALADSARAVRSAREGA